MSASYHYRYPVIYFFYFFCCLLNAWEIQGKQTPYPNNFRIIGIYFFPEELITVFMGTGLKIQDSHIKSILLKMRCKIRYPCRKIARHFTADLINNRVY